VIFKHKKMSKWKSSLVPTYVQLCNLYKNKFSKHIEIMGKEDWA